jgi:hypothetical protein
MAPERIPANIRRDGGVARMVNAVLLRARTFADATVRPRNDQADHGGRLHSCHGQSPNWTFCRGPDPSERRRGLHRCGLIATGFRAVCTILTVQESEVLTMADDQHHIGKHAFKVPFVCGCKNLGEALRRISEGAA